MNDGFALAPSTPELHRAMKTALPVIAVFSGALAILCRDKPLIVPIFCLALSAVLSLIWIKPRPLEMLFFIIPSLKFTIISLTGFFESHYVVIPVSWMLLLMLLWSIKSLSGVWNINAVRTPFIYPLIFYEMILILSINTHLLNKRSPNHLFQSILIIVAYWIIAQSLNGENFRRLLKALIWGSWIAAVHFLIVFSMGSPFQDLVKMFFGLGRPTILGYNSNGWAWSTLIGMPLLLAFLVHGSFKRFEFALAMVAAIAIVAELFISNSRSAMLAVYASTAFIMVTHPKTWKFFLYGSAATVLALFLLSSVPIFDLILQNIFRLQTGLSGRTYLWALAYDYILSHPFLGIGPGWFYERLIFDAPPMANILQMSSGSLSTHNSFLMIATDLGIFALLILLFMISFFLYRSFKLWTRLKNGPDFPLLVALCALMIALIIRALFETDFIMMHAYVTENLPFLIPLAIQDRLYAREFSTA